MMLFTLRRRLVTVGVLVSIGAIVVVAAQSRTPSRSPRGYAGVAGGGQARLDGLSARTAATFEPSTGPLDESTINERLRQSFAIFAQRPAVSKTPATAGANTSQATANAAFDSLVPTILHYWTIGHASTIMGQTSASNAELVMSSSDTPLLVLAGTEGACLAAPAPVGGGYVATCASAASVAAGGLGLQETGANEMLGVVPNGNHEVAVSEASGHEVSAPVVNNSFVVFGTSLPVKATYSTAAGNPTFMQGQS